MDDERPIAAPSSTTDAAGDDNATNRDIPLCLASASLNREEIEAVHFLADSLTRTNSQNRTPDAFINHGSIQYATINELPNTDYAAASTATTNQHWTDDFIQKLGNSLAYTVNRHSVGLDHQHLLAQYSVQAKMAKSLLPAYVLPQFGRDGHPTGNGIVFLVGERGRLIAYGPTAPFCPPTVALPLSQPAAAQSSLATAHAKAAVSACSTKPTTTTAFAGRSSSMRQQQQPQQQQRATSATVQEPEIICKSSSSANVVGTSSNVGSSTQIYRNIWSSSSEVLDAKAVLPSYLSASPTVATLCYNTVSDIGVAASASGDTDMDADQTLAHHHDVGQYSATQQSQLQHGSRRPRTTFEPWQIEKLEVIFSHESYPTKQAIHDMSSVVGLPDNTIRVWFQNRRAKIKREKSDDVVTTAFEAQ